MQLVFLIITAVLALLTVLPVSRHEAWWIRGLDFPRLQLFLVILITLFLVLLFTAVPLTFKIKSGGYNI